MRNATVRALALSILLVAPLLSGCAMLSMPYGIPLEPRQAAPAGKVLLVGEFVLDPPVTQGRVNVTAPRGKHVGVIKVYMSKDLRGRVDLNKATMEPIDEGMDVNMKGLSVVPLDPGTRYIRLGSVIKEAHLRDRSVGPERGGAGMTVDAEFLQLVRDLKLTVPAGAKAVYVGRITYRHDGSRATGVSVSDDYAGAMKELSALGIRGLTPSQVKKSLAVVVGK